MTVDTSLDKVLVYIGVGNSFGI